jgi:hypothetical protein
MMIKQKANWIGHILHRNCLLQRVTEGKIQGGIEVTGRQGRRSRKLLDDLKERTGYCHLKEEALDRTMWRARFGRGFGPVVRQTTKWMNIMILSKLLGSFILKVATVMSATTMGKLHYSMQPSIVCQISALNTSHDVQLLEFPMYCHIWWNVYNTVYNTPLTFS